MAEGWNPVNMLLHLPMVWLLDGRNSYRTACVLERNVEISESERLWITEATDPCTVASAPMAQVGEVLTGAF